jgi:hypothetical protein
LPVTANTYQKSKKVDGELLPQQYKAQQGFSASGGKENEL